MTVKICDGCSSITTTNQPVWWHSGHTHTHICLILVWHVRCFLCTSTIPRANILSPLHPVPRVCRRPTAGTARCAVVAQYGHIMYLCMHIWCEELKKMSSVKNGGGAIAFLFRRPFFARLPICLLFPNDMPQSLSVTNYESARLAEVMNDFG